MLSLPVCFNHKHFRYRIERTENFRDLEHITSATQGEFGKVESKLTYQAD